MNTYYVNRKKRNNIISLYLKRLALQLSIVFIIMLVMILIKYTNNETSAKINSWVREVILYDATEKSQEVFSNTIPNFKSFIDKLLNKKSEEFKIDVNPVEGQITSTFGSRTHPITKELDFHTGIDINVAEGTEVLCVLDGVVEKVETNNTSLGNVVTIKHKDGYETLYGHLSRVNVKEGQDISTMEVLGYSGNTGKSTGPHLHFEIIKDGKPIDPEKYINVK